MSNKKKINWGLRIAGYVLPYASLVVTWTTVMNALNNDVFLTILAEFVVFVIAGELTKTLLPQE